MTPNNNKDPIDNWNILFGSFIRKYIYDLSRYQDLIISTHLRLYYQSIDKSNYDILPNWIINNIKDTKLTPKQGDQIEESYSRNNIKRLVNKYEDNYFSTLK